MTSVHGYRITQIISQGPRFVLYRGEREQDMTPVIIKLFRSEHPNPSDIARMKHEYDITKGLDIPGVLVPVELVKGDGQPALVLEHLEAVCLKSILDKGMGFPDFLEMGISLAGTIRSLHQKNIVHKDINPFHVLIDSHTRAVKLTGLGLASVLPKENPNVIKPRVIEGSLPYISPEQTGRMNRSFDFRSDLYSLGATFYEALSGKLPFPSTDPLELVHSHMAKEPVPLDQLDEGIPVAVSAIVRKLMAKTPEERYQSAQGVIADLEECLHQWQATGTISEFPLGRMDMPETFQIPPKLYGRERETQRLLDVFEQTRDGKTRLVWISGYAGIGKTSLVQEIYKSMAFKGGHLISGKFDQFHRNSPYSALVHAFQDLMRQILTESEAELEKWRTRLGAALGPNGRIMTDVIPEVETVIGPQPPVQELGPVESQNRFKMVLLDFIRVFCRADDPLVIFLDDLHWVDIATLKFIHFIASEPSIRYLLLIGAYRNNEIHPNHPLFRSLEELRAHIDDVDEITLGPLTVSDATALLADTLHRNRESVASLAELVMSKTGGNPFFLNQFLQNLYEREFITFNSARQCWSWELKQIQESEMTDNVVDLMVDKIRALPAPTRHVLMLAACIGNQFDLRTLAIVNEKPVQQTRLDLSSALNEGLVLLISNHELLGDDMDSYAASDGPAGSPVYPVYKFRHDRVQQAAYSLIHGRRKKEVHLKIGRLLLESIHEDELAEKIFHVVHHLHFAAELITDPGEKLYLARLSLMAGTKAKASAAYEPALRYLSAGMRVLGEDSWADEHELTFHLYRHLAEAEYLNGGFEKSERIVALTLEHARSTLEKAELYRILIIQYTLQANYGEAYDVGRRALGLLDIRIPEKNEADLPELLDRQVVEINRKIGESTVSSLIDAPELAIPEKKLAVKLLSDMLPLTFFLNLNLFGYLTTQLVLLSLEYGYVPDCSYGFACYGRFLITRGEYKKGYEFGLLGMRLSERFKDLGQKCRCHNSFANFVQLWQHHIGAARDLNREAYLAGLQSGEFQFAGYSICNDLFNLFYQGHNLERILELCSSYEPFVKETRNRIAGEGIATVRWTMLNLIHPPDGDFGAFEDALRTGGSWKEKRRIRDSLMVTCHYRIYAAQLYYLYGKPEKALRYIRKASKILDYVVGSIVTAKHNFYYSLILAALVERSSRERQRTYLRQLDHNQEQMKAWADICPDNFLHKYLLVAAEIARLTGNDAEAASRYDHAIKACGKYRFIQDEALSNELAAEFYLKQGHEPVAETYMKKALFAYGEWGAGGKVQYLKEKYPHLLVGNDAAGLMERETSSDALDLSAIMKASQAISSEIVLEKLLVKLTRILIENAGAQRGFLILKSGNDELLIEAEVDTQRDTADVLRSIPVENGRGISAGIVKYVARTGEYVALNDASAERRFGGDLPGGAEKSKSVFCGPILLKSRLIGAFYLENRLVSGAFTSERIEVLKLLAAPMAISIENARLYANLEAQAEKVKTANLQLNREIVERKRAEEKYRSIFENALEGIFQATPDGRFVSANPALAGIFGFDSPEELIRGITDIGRQLYVDPSRRTEMSRMMRERREAASGFEVEMYKKDGTAIWVSIHARPVFDESGELILIEGILNDISESKRETEALRQREEYLRKENIRLRSNIRDRYKFGNIVGKSVGMQGVYDLILKAAATEVNVIVYGESGTGKELVARAIHDLSERRNKSFVTVNCGAVPENLLESEFFGYKKGAFTGAYADKPGYIELAHGGTLFLDELGEISLNMQVKLLRVLEGRGYMPVGDSQVKKADVRIVAATHRVLRDRVKEGLLREDFFYRIHVIPIYLPPLRERKEDIPLLIEHFQNTFDYIEKPAVIPGRILEALHNYDWPGNVRELQNTLQRYLMLGTLDFMGATSPQPEEPGRDAIRSGYKDQDLVTVVHDFEKGHILQALQQNQWQKSRTARSLGIDRKTLFRKMKEFGLNLTQNGA